MIVELIVHTGGAKAKQDIQLFKFQNKKHVHIEVISCNEFVTQPGFYACLSYTDEMTNSLYISLSHMFSKRGITREKLQALFEKKYADYLSHYHCIHDVSNLIP
jgi:hypothetical protein